MNLAFSPQPVIVSELNLHGQMILDLVIKRMQEATSNRTSFQLHLA